MMDPKNYAAPTDLLRDKVVLITGAGSGLGRALALQAASAGAQVILSGRQKDWCCTGQTYLFGIEP